MQKLKYRITTSAPILIADTRGGNNYVTTFDFIPGNTVLGMFAGKYVKLNSLGNSAHTDKNFRKFFLSNDLRFANAYIISKNEREEIINDFPIPLSVQYDKNNKSTVYDLLFQEAEKNNKKIQTNAFSEYGMINGETINYQPVKKSLNFHHERDPQTGSTKKGLIFNYESINEKQIFEGYILGEESDLEKFRLNFETSFMARIGRSKNVQYGKVNFDFIGEVEKLNSEIPDHKIEDITNVTLTFLSDVILFNKNGFSTTDHSVLLLYLQDNINSSVEIEGTKYFTKDNIIENYVSVLKLKRPSEISFKAGSCFKLIGITDRDKETLEQIQKEGIGERKNEGYGRIVLNYQRNQLVNSKILTVSEAVSEPSFPMPDIAKEKMKMIVRDLIIRQARYNAIIDENSFTDKKSLAKSKSLVSKLESFVKESKDKAEFDKNLQQLRSTAKNKLESCRMCNKTFFDWLVNHNDLTADEIINNATLLKLNEILREISYDVKSDTEFHNKLYQTYFLTFFAVLRKSLKKIGGQIEK